MKKVVTGVIILGFATLGLSQSPTSIKEVELTNVDVTVKNSEYQQKVSSENLPSVVGELQRKASRFDIKKSPFFDEKSKDFEIYFVAKNGELTATYDRDGKILKTFERFENLTFPAEIRDVIYAEYPNWTIHKDTYTVTYDQYKGVNKVYMAKIKKNGKSAKIKYDAAGQKLN